MTMIETGWEPGGTHVRASLRGLTKRERYHVAKGYISGDITPWMVRRLSTKGMFYLKITSPNGKCGHMELTPLGKNVRALLTGATDE